MMKDHTFDDILDEIQKDFPIPLPKRVLKKILKHSLRALFLKLRAKNSSVAMARHSVSRFYHPIDFKALELEFQDIDETKSNIKKGVSPRLLKFFHEKRSPRTVLRSKENSTFVYHRRGLEKQ